MAEQHESERKVSSGWGALGALEPSSCRDPSLGFADSGLLGRLAEEMYGELAFARAASRSSLARGTTRTFSPLSDLGTAKEADEIRTPNALKLGEART
ncbi:MAG TPA: hypothetical protein VKM54_23405 [Myxococcota bacterium]|nr:hypothetical protein [Myxococcota bacterium]